jgi:hypothetical protein
MDQPAGTSMARPTVSPYSHTPISGGSMPNDVSAVQIWLRWSVPWWRTCASRMPLVAR